MGRDVTFTYTNWKGETRERRVLPSQLAFTSSKWHPEMQWILIAIDLEKKTYREFAMKDIKDWKPAL
jgi:predicted DNA-binding transcriptional regulator YafY